MNPSIISYLREDFKTFNLKNRIFAILIFVIGTSDAQNNVGIGTLHPDSSAALDISSSTQGFLAPRLSSHQRMGIPNPADGLLVYDTSVKCYLYYSSTTSSWVSLCAPPAPNMYNIYNSDGSIPWSRNVSLGAHGNLSFSTVENTINISDTCGIHLSATDRGKRWWLSVNTPERPLGVALNFLDISRGRAMIGKIGIGIPKSSSYANVAIMTYLDTADEAIQSTVIVGADSNFNNSLLILCNNDTAGTSIFMYPNSVAFNTSAMILNTNLQYIDGSEGAGKVLTSDSDGNATWKNPVPTQNVILTDTILLSAAQIHNLQNTPVQLLPSPGAGHFVEILKVTEFYNYGTVPYAGGNIQVGENGLGGASFSDGGNVHSLASSNTFMIPLAGNSIALGYPVVANASSAIASGDGSVHLFITYIIH